MPHSPNAFSNAAILSRLSAASAVESGGEAPAEISCRSHPFRGGDRNDPVDALPELRQWCDRMDAREAMPRPLFVGLDVLQWLTRAPTELSCAPAARRSLLVEMR